nr:hypothetical protein [Tanacetum cinerariifolium]
MNIEYVTKEDSNKGASTPSDEIPHGNNPMERHHVWANLGLHKNTVHGNPWIFRGDFNVALNMEDSFIGSSCMNSAMCDFKDYVKNIEVFDINSSGLHFTWNQKLKGKGGILKKLDRIIAMLKIPSLSVTKPKLFKFYNFLAYKANFLEVVLNVWNNQVEGHSMYRVVQKNENFKEAVPTDMAMVDIGDDKSMGPDGYTSVCAFKVDIQKARDTVDWSFLGFILKCFCFHPVMIKWVMDCVTSTSFSICINGDVHGFFKGKRRLHQDSFRYHYHCEELQITNVCFVDDLFIFSRGDVESARAIMDSLNEFKGLLVIPSNLFMVFFGATMSTSMGKRRLLGMIYSFLNEKGTYRLRCLECSNCPLIRYLTPRDIHREGFKTPRSLKTQDVLRSWDVDPSTDLATLRCPPCGVQMDSHEHLFFQCAFSSQRSFKGVVGKLTLAASSYYIWLERNNRLFKNARRSPEELQDLIIVTVRFKLVTFRFKNNARVKSMLSLW